MKDLIRRLTETYGPSGHEERIREVIKGEIEGLADEVRTDALGNLIATRHGPKGAQKVMLSAHMDEIGIIVSYIDEGGAEGDALSPHGRDRHHRQLHRQ